MSRQVPDTMPEAAPDASAAPPQVALLGVAGIGEVAAGDDLAALVVQALARTGERLLTGDVVVVSSKIVSKAEGRTITAPSRDAAIEAETVQVVAERSGPRGLTRVVRSRSGPVLAAAGVDASNVAPGTVLLLPVDPDASARQLRTSWAAAGAQVGVVISDTAGRAWRDGQVDLAVGAAGIRVVDDLRGGTDGYGNPLEVTVRALADELAAAADLVKGKLRGVPVAVLRGLAPLVTPDDGPGARALLRDPDSDWFALGHVEAVRTALGAPPGTPGVDPAPLLPDGTLARLRRAVAVARAGAGPFDGARCRVEVHPLMPGDGSRRTPDDPLVDGSPGVGSADDGSPEVGGERAFALVLPAPDTGGPALLAQGAIVQRIVTAAWSEGLSTTVDVAADGRVTVRAQRENG